jgi:hypothetical protein
MALFMNRFLLEDVMKRQLPEEEGYFLPSLAESRSEGESGMRARFHGVVH